MTKRTKTKKFVLWFEEISMQDVPVVGGKNASLGEMYQNLIQEGIRVPNGFATTAFAYRYFLQKTKIKKTLVDILKDLNTHNIHNLMERGAKVRRTILSTPLPKEISAAIAVSYRKLEKQYGRNTDVAVRSSATAEDLPDASFAGQQETYLNIRGEKALIEACKKCYASLFTNRAISYRADKGFDHFKIALSIGVQKMVRSDLGSSGVMFSIDTETGFRNAVLINASWGLGEVIVKGEVTPDEFYVFKPTLKKGFRPILTKKLGDKRVKMIYANGDKPTRRVPVSLEDQKRFALTDNEVLALARQAVVIEEHYRKPMDIEWAKDGVTGKLFITQARPETVQSMRDMTIYEEYSMVENGQIVTVGSSVGSKIGAGKARVILDPKQIREFKKGEVLVTDMTDPDWEPIMKIASAIVTDRGGRTCHAAIVSRELGIPCIVGTGNASREIKTGQPITVSCADGEKGYVYHGILKYRVRKVDLKKMKRPRTQVMMNLGNPELAFQYSFIPNNGVGLAREEFIIASYIKVHPKALLAYPRLKDQRAKRLIEKITNGYRSKTQYFVDKLASGVAMIGAAFYPHDVIVRLSDFKTNEYANLIGGKEFEPKEENPMIGWRGASRYYSKEYEDAFALECKALKKVRDEMGLMNVKVMVPFCRTPEEGKKVIVTMEKYGLKQGKNGLEVYVMVEIPSNVLLGNEFAKVFDGFSIGSNDLTQLTLGLDRDSELVSHIYNERNEAVKKLIRDVISVAHKNKIKIGICGQAPSDFPDFAQFLARERIDSISLNPDTVIKTTLVILKAEKK